jgi:hypothetical protein
MHELLLSDFQVCIQHLFYFRLRALILEINYFSSGIVLSCRFEIGFHLSIKFLLAEFEQLLQRTLAIGDHLELILVDFEVAFVLRIES